MITSFLWPSCCLIEFCSVLRSDVSHPVTVCTPCQCNFKLLSLIFLFIFCLYLYTYRQFASFPSPFIRGLSSGKIKICLVGVTLCTQKCIKSVTTVFSQVSVKMFHGVMNPLIHHYMSSNPEHQLHAIPTLSPLSPLLPAAPSKKYEI